MATREEILARAKDIIGVYPGLGKNRVNQLLRDEFGVGLRSESIIRLKREVAAEQPRLLSELYARGGLPRGYREIYKGWINAGFLPFEARELTVGHGVRLMAFNSKEVFDSRPGREARRFRIEIIRQQLAMGWTKKQIRDNIIEFYRKGRKVDPWEHIRAEYKPRKRVDFIDYRDRIRVRAKARQRRLLKRRNR
ncbi:hypothetical protein LCGC14_1570600 [marine sediment metagenome]|uniref:Uncharacterized protein n=1 Tax=marine sediment metagenome TaxID=412755 RepID=A0A0F9L0W3_9ZZZZ